MDKTGSNFEFVKVHWAIALEAKQKGRERKEKKRSALQPVIRANVAINYGQSLKKTYMFKFNARSFSLIFSCSLLLGNNELVFNFYLK